VEYCCPVCRGDLEPAAGGFSCAACVRLFPVVLGFPDFRSGQPTEVDLEQDSRLAHQLAAADSSLDFEGLRNLYYELAPEASEELEALHRGHFDSEAEQAERAIGGLGQGEAFLDLGCGMGRYLLAASPRFSKLAGVDAALFQLVLARKFLSEHGVEATLLAAEAERLPFADGAFAAAVGADLLEHVAEPKAIFREVRRALGRDGRYFFATPNRYRVTAEPHVGLVGLGYLTHKTAAVLVKKRLGLDYSSIRPLSYWGLNRALRATLPTAVVMLPELGPRERAAFGIVKRTFAAAYELWRKIPLLRAPLLLIAPYFEVRCSS